MTLSLLKYLIRKPSLTPNDAGCQDIIISRLEKQGFTIERLRFNDVDNLWARRGTKAPLVVFAGHTDVVPTGPLDAWTSPPFEPTIRDDFLYGRGAADMKSGLACMITAAEQFIEKHPDHLGSIAFLITSDEEGPSIDGTKRVMETLTNRHEKIDYCIIGEASSEKQCGDQIRVGRRGSLTGKLIIQGKQGHVAFPEKAVNPIHLSAPFLKELVSTTWDAGNDFFPPTTFQLSNIHAGTGATNVIPGRIEIVFNFRFSSAITADKLKQRVSEMLNKHHLKTTLEWTHGAEPFLSKQGKLIAAAQKAIREITGLETTLSTGGGTSDGRFIAPTGAEVIELGPCNGSVHQIDEHVRLVDLDILTATYEKTLEYLL